MSLQSGACLQSVLAKWSVPTKCVCKVERACKLSLNIAACMQTVACLQSVPAKWSVPAKCVCKVERACKVSLQTVVCLQSVACLQIVVSLQTVVCLQSVVCLRLECLAACKQTYRKAYYVNNLTSACLVGGVGQNCVHTPYMTIYFVTSMQKYGVFTPYIYMVLANPT